MSDKIFDIVIIGGGPAGSACGIFLKRFVPQLSVCILDKAVFPRDKPCGDGLSPAVVDLLQEAGLDCLVQNSLPLSTIELTCGSSVHIKYNLQRLSSSRSYGYVINRKTFDHLLLQKAAASGVTVLENHQVTGISDLPEGGTQVHYRHPGGTGSVQGTVIVGADGAYSRIRGCLNSLPNKESASGIGLRYYCRVPANQEACLRIDILKNLGYSYGWLFPISHSTANIGIGIDKDVYKRKNINLNEALDNYVQQVSRSTPVEIIPGTRAGFPLPYGTCMPALHKGNKVLIGDAASMINPLTGEGIYYALFAGKLLAGHISEAHQQKHSLTTALSIFEVDFRHRFTRHYQLNQKIKNLLSSPFSGIVMRTLHAQPELLHKVMHVILGNAPGLETKELLPKIIRKSSLFLYEQLKVHFSKRSPGI